MITDPHVEKVLVDWKKAVEEFAIPAGSVTAAFQRLHRDRFKECEVLIVNSPRFDFVLNRLIKTFESGNHTVRWRAAYVMGEVMRLHPQEAGKQKAVNVLLKGLQATGFRARSPEGTEVIAALGKSEDTRTAPALLKILHNSWGDAAGVPHVFVSLGKAGNAETVTAISKFMTWPNLSKSAEIYLPWATGMLARLDCQREGFPLPRKPFRHALRQLGEVIGSSGKQPEMYRNAIYAVGRICDQRRTVSRPETELEIADVTAAKTVLEHKQNSLSRNGNPNLKQQIQMIDLALTMIQGDDLSRDQVILLEKVETILLVKVEEGGPSLP